MRQQVAFTISLCFTSQGDRTGLRRRGMRVMYQETPSTRKDFLLVPGNHNTTYSEAPELYETNVLAFLNQYVSRQVMAETKCRPDED